MANFKSIVSSVLLSTTLLSNISSPVFAAEENDSKNSSKQDTKLKCKNVKQKHLKMLF